LCDIYNIIIYGVAGVGNLFLVESHTLFNWELETCVALGLIHTHLSVAA